jgi:acyl-CoA hydrolase
LPPVDRLRSMADSTEMVQWVLPDPVGAPGQIHGGRMLIQGR